MSAATWVLLRGLTRDKRHWGAFPQGFGEHVHAGRVIALDLPGNGQLNGAASPTGVEAMAASARAELQRLEVAPPYHLLAMSLGAMVACAWAAERPGDIAGAVLINTSLRPFSPFSQRLRPRNYARLARLLLTSPTERTWEQTVLALTSRAPRSTPETDALLDAWATHRRTHPVSTRNALRQLLAAARFTAPPNAPPVPLLVLSSVADQLVDPRCSARLAAQWQCPIATHPWAGHDLPLDDGDWVARQVAGWLQRRSDAT